MSSCNTPLHSSAKTSHICYEFCYLSPPLLSLLLLLLLLLFELGDILILQAWQELKTNDVQRCSTMSKVPSCLFSDTLQLLGATHTVFSLLMVIRFWVILDECTSVEKNIGLQVFSYGCHSFK